MQEIERKFLITNPAAVLDLPSVHVIQGYLLYADDGTARVRIVDGNSAVLSIKKDISAMTRWEFEYDIPVKDAQVMIDQCCNGKVVEKRRCFPEIAGKKWDVDIFLGKNKGLLIAEIELESEEEYFERPEWLGEEVTNDERYYNAYLAEHPYGEGEKG